MVFQWYTCLMLPSVPLQRNTTLACMTSTCARQEPCKPAEFDIHVHTCLLRRGKETVMNKQLSVSTRWLTRTYAVMAASLMLAASVAQAEPKLPEGSITVKANGQVSLAPESAGAVFVTFEGSKTLTERLIEAAKGRGLTVVDDAATAKTTITMSGELVLIGGPKFYRGKRWSLGEVSEQALVLDGTRPADAADVFRVATDAALAKASYESVASTFLKGVNLSALVSSLGEASGVGAWFNKAVAGDPRGVCLSKCADWLKTKQTAYVKVTVVQAGQERKINVMGQAHEETLAPEEVVGAVMARLFEVMAKPDETVAGATPTTQ